MPISKPLQATLERFCYSPDATFGNLITPKGMHYATVERSWQDNKPSISCIPIGEYKCAPRRYNRGGYDAIELLNVIERTHILMHIGNFANNSNGCILINTMFGSINNEWCGLSSTNAFNSLMSELGGLNFNLTITNKEGGIL